MPRIPDFSVQADSRAGLTNPAHFDVGALNPSQASLPFKQQEAMGNAFVGMSDSLLKIATKMQDEVNQTRVDDARSSVRAAALDLAYNKENGYLTQKGLSAVERPDGISLVDEYATKLQEKIAEINDRLGNDEQKRVFGIHANDMATMFKGDVQKHTLQEWNHYSLSVQDGAIKLGVDEAARNWTDPLRVDTALQDVQRAVVTASNLKGEQGNEAMAKLNVATSLVHSKVIEAALANGNSSYASSYFNTKKDKMTADDILKVNSALNKDVDGRIVQSAVGVTSDKFAARWQPTETDRLKGVVLALESGGKDYEPAVTKANAGVFGTRPDGTLKGNGFLGPHKSADGKSVMTEFSVGVTINGKQMDVPTMVPTLTPTETKWLLAHPDAKPNEIPGPIVQKAADHARERIDAGKSVYAEESALVSPKGAMYKQQVMVDTAENPGFGIMPARDMSAKEINRVGEQYLQALVMKYGNTAMAMAAYNAGPGKDNTSGFSTDGKPLPGLAPAMARAAAKGNPNAWLGELPKETQKYVQKGMSAMDSGQGSEPPPTIGEFISHAVSLLGPNPRPELVKSTQAAAEHSYNLINKSVNERVDQAQAKGLQILYSNGGDLNGIDYNTRSMIMRAGPEKWNHLVTAAERIRKGPDETNPALYLDVSSNPDRYYTMPQDKFLMLRTQLSDSDFKHFVKERDNYQNGKTDDTFEGLNYKAVQLAANSRMVGAGINPTPKADDMEGRQQVGTVMKYIRDDILATQKGSGKKMTQAEIERHVDQLFARDLTFRNTFMGFETTQGRQNMLTMKASDIPGDALTKLKSTYSLLGVREPTDDQLLRLYWADKGPKRGR